LEDVIALFELPFGNLMDRARQVHLANFDSNAIQVSTLLNVKTGSCPENCSYCPQSAHYNTGLEVQPLMDGDAVFEAAQKAKAMGSTRFCMGAAWRGPRDEDLEKVATMVTRIKALGMETCVTLGLLKEHQAVRLKEAGLDFYNHNIDSSESFYQEIITTRQFSDRVQTMAHVKAAGLKTCCGGILGMGETVAQRAEMLQFLANMENPPTSVPINQLIPIPGTPLADQKPLDPFDFIRTVAVARILMPSSYVRLSAGREDMSDEMQAWCFYAGANSIFFGEKLLTAPNPLPEQDMGLMARLGVYPEPLKEAAK
jgi:biotin synthase